MNNIFCIGMGPGGAEQVTRAALQTAASVPFLLGDARFLALVAAGPSVAPQHLEELPRGTEATLRRVAELLEKGPVGVLVSGDTGFYSLASSWCAGSVRKRSGSFRASPACSFWRHDAAAPG